MSKYTDAPSFTPTNFAYPEFAHALAPISVSVKEYDGNFYSGEKVARTVSVYNETYGDVSLRLAIRFEVVGTGKVFGKRELKLEVPAGEYWREELEFSLHVT